ncbi:MAG: NTP transferase domain-containing protein, partial [Methylobacteriaceae bacterium]|nr:NTP transferase domain-containing protein [Methylobacteriaceae bacterium]
MIAGVILAGGRARRMGGAVKAGVTLGGISLFAHVRRRLEPQCALLLVSGGDPGLPVSDLPVIVDEHPGLGPVCAVAGVLGWLARRRPECRWLAVSAVDTPFLPEDFVSRLHHTAVAAEARLAVARSGAR